MPVSQAVRHDAVNAMLSEFLKENSRVEKLEATSRASKRKSKR
jgi:hypothetical protein